MKLLSLLALSLCFATAAHAAEGEGAAGAAKEPVTQESGPANAMKATKAPDEKLSESNVAKKADKKIQAQKEGQQGKKKKGQKVDKRADGLEIEDVVVGKGKEAKLGSKITVHYRGTLAKNGQEFDSSYKRNEPITFELAEGRLIKGWTEGIPGMKVGGKRKLHIPYAMAYGEQGTPGGPIGPKEDLNFEVELKDVN